MPLLQPVLLNGLMQMDDPSPGADPGTAAAQFHGAWWQYYSGCTQLNPATLPIAFGASLSAFVPVMSAAMALNQSPTAEPFFLALEGALRAVLAATLTPVTMVPGLAAGVPSPVPLFSTLSPIPAVGIVSPTKAIPRALMATLIDVWMHTNTVTFVPPATGAIPLA